MSVSFAGEAAIPPERDPQLDQLWQSATRRRAGAAARTLIDQLHEKPEEWTKSGRLRSTFSGTASTNQRPCCATR